MFKIGLEVELPHSSNIQPPRADT